MDLIVKAVFVASAVAICALLFIAIPQEMDRSDRSRVIANEMGCVYIGYARDLTSVRFFDCNGVIKMERVK